MTRYKAVLFSPDGEDWVTDYRNSPTVAEVEERLADQGSRWFFYPFAVVVRDGTKPRSYTGHVERQRIVSGGDFYPFGDVSGMTVRQFGRMLAENRELVEAVLA